MKTLNKKCENQIFLICLKISFGQKVKYVYSNHCSSYRKILNKFSNLHILSCVLNFKLKNAYLLEKVWQPPWRTSVGPPRGPPQNPPAPRWSPPPGNAAGRSPWPSLEPTCCQAPWNKQQFKLVQSIHRLVSTLLYTCIDINWKTFLIFSNFHNCI